MKNLNNRCLVFFMLFFILAGCDNFLNPSLKISVLFRDTKGVQVGAAVIHTDSKQQIGKVTKVEVLKNGEIAIDLEIQPEFKDLVRKKALFALDSPIFGNYPVRVVMRMLPEDTANSPLATGATVPGVSWAEYNTTDMFAKFRPMISDLIKQWEDAVDELDRYLKSKDFDQFLQSLGDEAERIENFTKEQKQQFEDEILPELEKKVDQAIKQFEKMMEKSEIEKLQKKLDEMKKKLG